MAGKRPFITRSIPFLPAFIIILTLSQPSCRNTGAVAAYPDEADTLVTTTSPVTFLFDIVPDSFIAEPGRIGKNDLISGLLLAKGFSYHDIDEILNNNNGSFDPRKVKRGSSYIFYSESDTASRPSFLVYEHDKTLSHIFSLENNRGITDFRHDTRHEIRFASGIIESSLWEAVGKAGVNPMLAVELSEIYAWTIDFFGLQKEDQFRVIYEEVFTGSQSAGITSVNGAIFTHAGKEFVAIPFYQDGKVSFYDEKGNSLRKAFLKAPLRFTRISSGYSSGRMHPILKIVRPHYGVDYAAPAGTPVVAIGDGKVISASSEAAEGKVVRIRHNSVYSTAYLHLSAFARGITAGAWVRQGEVIGYVGSTGLSTGPHLDFRFYKNGTPVDPLKVEAPPVEPVSEENMGRFSKITDIMYNLLRGI